MNHLSEEQIVLHYYGDAENSGEIERHLAGCSECRAQFEQVQSLLKQIELVEAPEPAAGFEEKTWLNLRQHCCDKPRRCQSTTRGSGSGGRPSGTLADVAGGGNEH